ncbi:uncharacterized protein FA14DRAFT_78406 [Meira miltonrushii]|uniref:Protein kinase domain-containing protein n=1 Tax=Meira miltonrushii TaxID=1280837 RepID=A0A316V5N0_9BASI|nr:uncharacterized protein FA14DRAFT_78406 [Meira miltonrushii]PWN32826.1 hypothetical protein FA14DRAFT_78406 [Meira miltonrushii]
MQAPPPRQRTAEEERARAAAKQAEKDLWERTRGAGSAVFKLADAGRIKPGGNASSSPLPQEREDASTSGKITPRSSSVSSRARSSSKKPRPDSWTEEDILPALEEVESKLYEPVDVPSADMLLSRGICDYTLLPKTLGRGKFSTVFVACKSGELTAIKHTALFPHHQLIATRLLREPTLLAELPPHPNLVTVKETIRTPGHFYLVEEYLDGYVTLEALLPILCPVQPHILPLAAAERILAQLLSAVHAIHVPLQICHRDIKPENILVHPQTLQLKLLDFGLATHFSKSEAKLSTCCGSPAFHCPEIVKALSSPPGSVMYMGPEVDAWTCGVTMLRCLTGARFPLGASHSSLRGMSIRAQRAVASIGDASMRDKIGALLDMDGKRRMARFEEMVKEQEKSLGQIDRTAKKFKSTTFIPSKPTHSIRLPLVESATDTHAKGSPSGAATPVSASRRSTPSNSRAPSPSRSLHGGLTNGNSVLSSTTLVALNPTNQPPERVVSFIKYCLRCAGILYHTWPDYSGMAKTPKSSFFGPQTPTIPTTSVSAAFAEAVGTSLDAITTPSTPLFAHTYSNTDERSDGYAHVQVFQCVIELPDEKDDKDGKGGSGQLSLVQSIMAAFGRKPSQSPAAPVNREYATYGKTNSPDTRPQYRRSASSPAQSRERAHAPTMPSKDGSMRCLAFHLIIRFPRQPQSMIRQAVSRASSYYGNLQSPYTNHSNSHASITRSRANSSAGAMSHDVSENEGPSASEDQRGRRHTGSSRSGQSDGRKHVTVIEEPINESSDVLPSDGPGLPGNGGHSSSTSSVESSAPSQQPFPRMPNRSPSTSRPASRTRTRSSRGIQKRAKVYIQVTDERAVPIIREALSVGGTLESHELDDRKQSQGLHVNVEGLHGKGGDGSQQNSRRARRRTRDSASMQIKAWPTSPLDSVSVPQSPTLVEGQVEENVDTKTSTVNVPASGEEAEEKPRGRTLVTNRARYSSEDTVVEGAHGTEIRAPSNLSTVALKEESPHNDNLKQLIDSLQRTLHDIIHLSKASQRSSAASSPLSRSGISSPQMEKRFSDIQTTYDGRHEGLLAQTRTLLLDISNSLQCASRKGKHVVEELVTPLSFEIFNALSPALGLIPIETVGLPAPFTASEEAEESITLRGLAMATFDLFAQHCSPREIYMAVQERMEVLGERPLQGKQSQMETSPDKNSDSAESPSEQSQTKDLRIALPQMTSISGSSKQQVALWSAALELAGLLHVIAKVMPRIKTKKPIQFIQPLVQLVPRCVKGALQVDLPQSVGITGASPSPYPPVSSSDDLLSLRSDRKSSTSELSIGQAERAACEIVISLVALLRDTTNWAKGMEGEMQDKVLELSSALLLTSMIVLLPQMPQSHNEIHLSDHYFYQWFPRYKIEPSSKESPPKRIRPTIEALSSQAWKQLDGLVRDLKIDNESLAFDRQKRQVDTNPSETATSNEDSELIGANSSVSAAAKTMGAFILHVNLLARAPDISNEGNDPIKWTAKEGLKSLQRSMGMLVACLGSNIPATTSQDGSQSLGGTVHLPDIALTWAIWCIRAMSQGSEGTQEGLLSSEEAIIFVQVLSSHSALSPRPMARHISLRIVQTVLQSLVEPEIGRELLRDLMCESPYPQLSAAAIGLARQLISSDLDRIKNSDGNTGQPIIFAQKSFIHSFATKVFSLSDGAEVLPNVEEAGEPRPKGVVIGLIKSYLDDHAPKISETTSFIYLVLTKDHNNLTGIRDADIVSKIKDSFLHPLHEWLEKAIPFVQADDTHKESAESNTDVQMGLSILNMSVEQAMEAVSSIP